jgi:HlyD family secretion protein
VWFGLSNRILKNHMAYGLSPKLIFKAEWFLPRFVMKALFLRFFPLGILLLMAPSCHLLPPGQAQQGPPQAGEGPGGRGGDRAVAVKTAKATAGGVADALTYTGTTRPLQEVALRAQVPGEVVSLDREAGDFVTSGEIVARLDGDLQTASVNEAQAELAARRAETAQADVSISDAQLAVVQAQATFDQAVTDANRLGRLAAQGAISLQEAEAAALAATNAQQSLRSAQAQVAVRQQAANTASSRIDAQQAVLDQSQEQLSSADLRSPLTGVVLARNVDVGSYVESGATLLSLGDLSALKVTVQVSELDVAKLSVGQRAQVRFDAFPNRGVSGEITQISPLANATSRQIPVEIELPNPDGQIGSGLLARVTFVPSQRASVAVPASALRVGETAGNTLFVLKNEAGEAGEAAQGTVEARSVRIGDRTADRVEILSGLSPGESFVVQSDRPLTSGQKVRLSLLSEK